MMGFDFGLDRLIIGLFTGLTYGTARRRPGAGLPSSRFVNFAHGAVGAFGASVLGCFVADLGLPVLARVPAGDPGRRRHLRADRGRRGPPAERTPAPDRHDRHPGPVPAHPGDGAAGQQRGRQRLHLPRAAAPAVLPDRQPCRSGTPYIAMLLLAPVLLAGLRLVPAATTGSASASAPPPTTRTPRRSTASRRAGWPPWPGRSPAPSPPSPRSW